MKTTYENLRSYIQRTGMKDPGLRFDICIGEIKIIHDLFKTSAVDAISLAYYLGQARGYRLARSSRKGVTA